VQNVGAGFYITKRGGQVTYHGPGQIVGYALFDLNAMQTPTRCYVEYLQALLAEYNRDLGLEVYAPHPDGHVGVFPTETSKVGKKTRSSCSLLATAAHPLRTNAQVASIGIHLRHRVTSHGFAMNITPEPKAWFDLVTACGLDDVRAVSIHDLINALPADKRPPLPSVRDVANALVPRFADTFKREFLPLEDGSGDEIDKVKEIVEDTEHEAAKALREAGAWPTAPKV